MDRVERYLRLRNSAPPVFPPTGSPRSPRHQRGAFFRERRCAGATDWRALFRHRALTIWLQRVCSLLQESAPRCSSSCLRDTDDKNRRPRAGVNFRKVVNSVPLGKQSRNPGVEVNGYVDPHAHLFRRRPHTIRKKPSWRGERLFMVTPIEVEVGDRTGAGPDWARSGGRR
jgi:hypothetical protein